MIWIRIAYTEELIFWLHLHALNNKGHNIHARNRTAYLGHSRILCFATRQSRWSLTNLLPSWKPPTMREQLTSHYWIPLKSLGNCYPIWYHHEPYLMGEPLTLHYQIPLVFWYILLEGRFKAFEVRITLFVLLFFQLTLQQSSSSRPCQYFVCNYC